MTTEAEVLAAARAYRRERDRPATAWDQYHAAARALCCAIDKLDRAARPTLPSPEIMVEQSIKAAGGTWYDLDFVTLVKKDRAAVAEMVRNMYSGVAQFSLGPGNGAGMASEHAYAARDRVVAALADA